MPAAGLHRLGGVGLGLFDEARELQRGRGGIHVRGGVEREPAIAGFGAFGHDAEGDEIAVDRGAHAGAHRRAEGRGIGDRVIRRADQQEAVRRGLGRLEGGGEHCGGGVAPVGLDENRAGGPADLGQLFGGDEAELAVGHHDRRREIGTGKRSTEAWNRLFSPSIRLNCLG